MLDKGDFALGVVVDGLEAEDARHLAAHDLEVGAVVDLRAVGESLEDEDEVAGWLLEAQVPAQELPVRQREGHLLDQGPLEVMLRVLLEDKASTISNFSADPHVLPPAHRKVVRESLLGAAVEGGLRLAEGDAGCERDERKKDVSGSRGEGGRR